MDLNIRVDLSELMQTVPVINAEILPRLHEAVGAVAQATANQWKEGVYRASIWDGEKKPYMESITWRWTGDFSAVVESDYRLAQLIETGRPERDLKKMLDTSVKVRQSKDGKRYLIIPFRHNVPGASAHGRPMPDHVYEAAKQLSPSRVTGQGRRQSGTGAYDTKTRRPLTVNQNQYQWGDRMPAGLAPKLRTHHKTDPYAGMVRFDTSSGASKRSTYLTFRTMMEGSSGWIAPAKPGLYIAKGVVDEIRPQAEAAFGEAINRDLSL